jgi:hypothetical protein
MGGIDPNVPKRIVREIAENSPHESKWSEDLKILLNPSIEAKPLHLPQSGQIRLRKNKDFEYFWALDRGGDKPFHERVDQLRAVGFQFATVEDVEMMIEDTVKEKNEIRNGDRRLMKVAKQRWAEIRKSQMMDAIRLTSPRDHGFIDPSRNVMRTDSLTPGIKTMLTDDAVVADIKNRSDAQNTSTTKGANNG